MAHAARLNDPVGHSPTMSWLLGGLIAAAAIAVTAVAVVGTGGLAAAAIIGGAAAAGGGVGEMMSTMSWAPKEEVGNVNAAGSPNVFTNGLRAIRAHLDSAKCDKHSDTEKVATGSATVFINSMPAARVDDKTTCSATITKGSGNVNIGGATVQTDEIHAENLVPTWVHVAMFVVGAGAAFVLAAPAVAIGGILGGIAGGMGGEWLGGKIFGEGSDGQKWTMFGGSLLGGFFGAKGGAKLWNPKSGGSAPSINTDEKFNPLKADRTKRNGNRLVLKQGNIPTCGHNSSGMLLDTLGKSFDIPTLIERVPYGDDGIYPHDVVALLKSEGVRSNYWPNRNVNDLARYTKDGTPVIVVIADRTNNTSFRHFVVVDGVTTRNGVPVVAIRDPHGLQYFSPLETFKKNFTKEVIVPRRN